MVLQGLFLYSQCISVELAIKWEKGFYIYPDDSIACIPKLFISYRNNSNYDYYFYKLSNGSSEYPECYRGTLMQYPFDEYINPDYLKRALNHLDYSKENFRVLIGSFPSYHNPWIVENDTGNRWVVDGFDIINDELADIYYYLTRKKYNGKIEVKTDFSESDLHPDSIFNSVNEFVFLRKGEVHTDIFNLIGFEMVKGTFTFQLNPEPLKNYVFAEIVKDEKFTIVESKLPDKVGDYQLFFGEYKSNQISITFK